MRSNFLFVHGAWQGAWVWKDILAKLRGRDRHVEALDLPGNGDDMTPIDSVTLESYARAILTVAKAMPPGPIILVGHSMGGAAITAAASLESGLFAGLVYVCAFAPREGESVASLAKEGYTLGYGGPKSEPVANGAATRLLPEHIASTFLNDCDADLIAKVVPRFKPQPIKPVTTPIVWGKGFELIPKHCIVCTQDRAIAPELQTTMALRVGIRDVHVLDSGHEPFFSQSAALTEILLNIDMPT